MRFFRSSHGPLHAAIVLTEVPATPSTPGTWSYTIRMNASEGRLNGFDYQGVPDTFQNEQKDDLQVWQLPAIHVCSLDDLNRSQSDDTCLVSVFFSLVSERLR